MLDARRILVTDRIMGVTVLLRFYFLNRSIYGGQKQGIPILVLAIE